MDPLKAIRWGGGLIALGLVTALVWVLVTGSLSVGRPNMEAHFVTREGDPIAYWSGIGVLVVFIAGYLAGWWWVLRRLPALLKQVEAKRRPGSPPR